MNDKYSTLTGKVIEGFGFMPGCRVCGEKLVFDPSQPCMRCAKRRPKYSVWGILLDLALVSAFVGGMAFLFTRRDASQQFTGWITAEGDETLVLKSPPAR